MNCPKCNHVQVCGCDGCQYRQPTDKPFVFLDEEYVACGNCGYTLHYMDWIALNVEHLKAKGLWW